MWGLYKCFVMINDLRLINLRGFPISIVCSSNFQLDYDEIHKFTVNSTQRKKSLFEVFGIKAPALTKIALDDGQLSVYKKSRRKMKRLDEEMKHLIKNLWEIFLLAPFCQKLMKTLRGND
ncbi:CLUMA_CG003941, isoform A [Clunio marinus]|uniref:CLUMA_CG003941, isoform A n=1 Tax=Clunio marinus TaxID=568069 RepID=A0A1J1HS66_9DIPT|nr:CLUMA_CG003941, isoform A [Clunio marinus]